MIPAGNAIKAGVTASGYRGSVIPASKLNHKVKLAAYHQCQVQIGRMHKHLRRLEHLWIDWPIYFITTCTMERRAILACKEVAAILIDEWCSAHNRHGWAIGRYVIMPDHVHFFCRAEFDAKPLSIFMQKWKEWTSKQITREPMSHAVAGIGDPGGKRNHGRSHRLRLQGISDPGRIWQEEFFDHILRSSESYSQKWDYVKDNPVRAGLVERSDDWPWQGEVESLML